MFRGVQKFAAYDKHGKLVAGDLEKELTVEDIWVFEKHLSQPEAKWRLCGRLSV
jgi:large subunit ribosomal protein L45